MKIRLSTASAYSALLVAFLLSVAHSQEAMPPEMVEVKSMGQTITLAAADVSRIRVKADEVVYDPATFVTYLKGATVVTLQIGLTRTTSLQDAEATVKGGPIELQIAAGSSIEADHFAPIRTLTASLQSDSPMLYRVNWYHVVFQNYSDGTALYDRQQGTLTEYLREGDEERRWVSHRIYRGVNDDILRQMARDAAALAKLSPGSAVGPYSFEKLTDYGCTRITVK